ncbi:efflux RND transporter periplasmic adaptor subunit [Hirschia maritima]|uniref:efflux RND transporter periplasmic adaptor subunit n=1 Tax=Hirschia maritima TaxID=1121961 RepID=UPI00035D634D|nr:efflux RND transporter periplasmic adaptor subunit [Hirschia maritima]
MFFKFALPSIVLFSGAGTTVYLANGEQETTDLVQQKPKGSRVSTQTLHRENYQLTFRGFGTIEARETIKLTPQVSGRISETKNVFEAGSYVSQDEILFLIDPREFEIELSLVTAELAKAKENLRLEQGRQLIAQHEWLSLDAETRNLSKSTSLALRQPQLETIKAEVEIAQSKVDLAKLNLERSQITAPCNGVILEESIASGNTVAPGDIAVTIACSDYYAINTSLPISYLNYLDLPQSGVPQSDLIVKSMGTERRATMTSLLAEIDKNIQMAQLRVHIEKPLSHPQVLLGAHAEVEIPASNLTNVFVVPASLLRQNDTLWILSEENTLEIRTVQPEVTNNGNVIIREGLTDGEQIITSPLPLPVEGMLLRTEN